MRLKFASTVFALMGAALQLTASPAHAYRPAEVTQVLVPTENRPHGIVVRDGKAWIAHNGEAGIGRYVRKTSTYTTFPVPGGRQPFSLTLDATGNVWFTIWKWNQIGRMTPAGRFTFYTVPTGPGDEISTYGIKVAPDGRVWYTQLGGRVGFVVPSTGAVRDFPSGINSTPQLLTIGPSGNVWFTDAGRDSVARMTPTGTVRHFAVTPGSHPYGITVGPDHAIWFTELAADIVGTIDPTTSAVKEYRIPTAGAEPRDIVTGLNEQLWFTQHAGRLGVINTRGVIEELSIPGPAVGPLGIARAPDSTIWYTVHYSGQIGKVTKRFSRNFIVS